MVYFRSLLLRVLLIFFSSIAFSSIASGAVYSTSSAAKGPWTTVGNWSTAYPGCCNINGGATDVINIYGYITVGTTSVPQNLTISKGLLSVSDTLIIYGDLAIGNNGDLTITGTGVLIVYGNVSIANQVTLAANSYFIIMGNLSKSGSQGTFTSDDQPSNVFIGGTISGSWSTTGPNDVLNCNLPLEHESSNCNYGDPIDLQDSPIADIVNSNCTDIPVITGISVADATVDVGSTIQFSATGTTLPANLPLRYTWSGPANFSGTAQNPSRANAQITMTGYYRLILFNARGCASKDSVYVDVLCTMDGGSVGTSQSVCLGNNAAAFTSVSPASPGTFTYQWYSSTNSSNLASGTWSAISGQTGLTYSAGAPMATTSYYRKATETGGCTGNSNVLTISIYTPVETGNVYNIPNEFYP